MGNTEQLEAAVRHVGERSEDVDAVNRGGVVQEFIRVPANVLQARIAGEIPSLDDRPFALREIGIMLDWAKVAEKEHPHSEEENILLRRLFLAQIDAYLREQYGK